MARILLNTRASRITLVANIMLLPAEVKNDERRGNVITPSKTIISERGNKLVKSQFQQIEEDVPTQKLFLDGMIAWSDEKVDEPALAEKSETVDSAEEQVKSLETAIAVAEGDLATLEKAHDEAVARKETLARAVRSGATSPTGGFRARNQDLGEAERLRAEHEARTPAERLNDEQSRDRDLLSAYRDQARAADDAQAKAEAQAKSEAKAPGGKGKNG